MKFPLSWLREFVALPSNVTADQVAEIERLLSIVKADEADIEKWKTKAGAETFAEFTTAQAAGILTVLNKKLSK